MRDLSVHGAFSDVTGSANASPQAIYRSSIDGTILNLPIDVRELTQRGTLIKDNLIHLPPPLSDDVLREDGSFVLREDGSKVVRETLEVLTDGSGNALTDGAGNNLTTG